MSSTTITVPGVVQSNTTVATGAGDTDAWKTTTSPRVTFLSFFILFGMVGNTCLIITICHSRRFRTTAFYIFIINLTVVNLCECLLNMTILMSTSVANSWTHGDIPCRLNAFFIHLVCIETLLSLTILTTDRMVAVKYREKYEHVISLARFSLLISFSWIQSFAFSVPIAAGAVPVSADEYIHYCKVAEGAPVAYCAFLTTLCYIGPLIICVCFFIFIVKTWYKDRFAVRALLAQNNYDENAKDEPRIRREILYSNLAATVCISWLILQGPYVVTFIFKLFRNSVELDSTLNESLQYAWHVDLVLLFLKFSYVLVLPIAAFVWLKELRKELKDMVLCRKNNAVIDASMKKSKFEVQKLKNTSAEEKLKETLAQQKEQRVFQVPVLFATSHGVHIKKVIKLETDDSDKRVLNGTMHGMKCDVVDSRNNLNAFGDDTSDYDSGNEMDPFSVSHPVSVKQLKKNDSLTEKHRSNSQPEVRGMTDKVKVCNNTVGSTSAGDSGLDLSTEYNSMSRPSLECTKEYSVSSINGVEINSETSESIKHELTLQSPDTKDIVSTVSYSSSSDSKTIVKSPSKETVLSKIGEVVVAETKPDNILKSESALSCIESTCSNSNMGQAVDDQNKKQQGEFGPVLQKRKKKKKRKETLDDMRSVASNDGTSSPKLPLRRPARLAPIGGNVVFNKSQYSALSRPDSSCSNQSSSLGNYNDGVCSQHSVRESDIAGHSSFAHDFCNTDNDNHTAVEDERGHYSSSSCSEPNREGTHVHFHSNFLCDSDKSTPMSLDCNVPLNSQVEVLTPSDCHVVDGLPLPVNSNVGIDNPTYVGDSEGNLNRSVLKNDTERKVSDSSMVLTFDKDQKLLINDK